MWATMQILEITGVKGSFSFSVLSDPRGLRGPRVWFLQHAVFHMFTSQFLKKCSACIALENPQLIHFTDFQLATNATIISEHCSLILFQNDFPIL